MFTFVLAGYAFTYIISDYFRILDSSKYVRLNHGGFYSQILFAQMHICVVLDMTTAPIIASSYPLRVLLIEYFRQRVCRKSCCPSRKSCTTPRPGIHRLQCMMSGVGRCWFSKYMHILSVDVGDMFCFCDLIAKFKI
jgi:hypothetical protein